MSTRTESPSKELTQVVSLAETVVSGPGYLSKCKSINPSRSTGQIPYRDIWPGRTKESELESLLGTPDSMFTMKGVTNWVYGDVGLFAEKGVITDVLVEVDKESALTLEQLLRKYGCPDLILAVNTTQDKVGYTATRFIYLELGIEFNFTDYPVRVTDVLKDVAYFQPMNLQAYLDRNGWALMGMQAGKPIEWVEAVR